MYQEVIVRRGVGSSRRRNRKRVWIISILFVLCLALVLGYVAYENLVFTADGVQLSFFDSLFNKEEEDKPEENPDLPKPTITTEAPTTQATTQATEAPKPELPDLSAKWITLANLKNENYVNSLINDGVKQILVTVKDKDGIFYLPAENDIINGKNIVADDAEMIANSIKILKDNDVYIICGISALRDNILARAHRNEAVTTNGETLWLDRDNMTWFDPSSETAANYIIAMADALYDLGIDEVMLTNFAYPYMGKYNLIMNKPDENVLAVLAEKIAESDMPMGVVAVTAADKAVTGQNISLLEEHFDRIMVTGSPESDSTKNIAGQMKDLDKLTYIVDNPIENVNHIYTK